MIDFRSGMSYPVGVRGLRNQLVDAFQKTSWSMDELLKRSKLDLDRSTLRRKMIGETKISAEECQAIAAALGITITWSSGKEARR